MKFYLTYFLKRWLTKRSPDIPQTSETRMVFPLKFHFNFEFDIASFKLDPTREKLTIQLIAAFFEELYKSIDRFAVVWGHIFGFIIPLAIILKLLVMTFSNYGFLAGILTLPLVLFIIEVAFSLLFANAMKMTRAKILKYLEEVQSIFVGLNSTWSVSQPDCLYMELTLKGQYDKLSQEEGSSLVGSDLLKEKSGFDIEKES